MDIWEPDKLLLFVAFVIPGFISLKTYELLVPGQAKDSSTQLIDAVAYSCLNYAVLLPIILKIKQSQFSVNYPIWHVIFQISVLFVFPVIWVLIWKHLREKNFLQKNAPHPIRKPWDYIFSKRERYWVIVTLNDKTQIAGKYSNESFSSSAPADDQIYLEEAWVLNDRGGFDRARKKTKGILITSKEIATVELFQHT